MQRLIAGTCRMELRLTPDGPWLVRGQPGEAGDRQGQVLYPLLDREGGTPVLPASSLKGVLRSTAERILRTVAPPGRSADLPPLADVPFVHTLDQLRKLLGRAGGPGGDAERLELLRRLPRGAIADSELADWAEWREPPPDLYARLSPASQLFGCTLHAGLVTLEDAHAAGRQTQRRSHVAIDRFTGGAGRGLLFVEELAPAAQPLTTTLTISNFALWQLALVGLALREISAGYVGLGGGTRKGQGKVTLEVTGMDLGYADLVYRAAAPARPGVISAQAWRHRAFAERPWLRAETPRPVLAAEGYGPDGGALTLLPGLTPADAASDWRHAGTVRFALGASESTELFRAAVAGPWGAWLAALADEKGGADAAA